jgi:hypothetical protein
MGSEHAEVILPTGVNNTQPDVELPIKAFYIGACGLRTAASCA